MIVFKLAEVATAKDPSMTPTKIHYATGISYPTVLRLWNNDGKIDKIALSTLDILCEFLGCTPGDMIQLTDAKLDPLTISATGNVKDSDKKE